MKKLLALYIIICSSLLILPEAHARHISASQTIRIYLRVVSEANKADVTSDAALVSSARPERLGGTSSSAGLINKAPAKSNNSAFYKGAEIIRNFFLSLAEISDGMVRKY